MKNKISNKEWKELFSERLLKFSVKIIKLSINLPKTPAGFAIAGQLIRAATSIGANFQEAQDASSTRDFIQKLSISLREARESCYWLKVIKMSELLIGEVDKELLECEEIIAILTSSVKKAKIKMS